VVKAMRYKPEDRGIEYWEIPRPSVRSAPRLPRGLTRPGHGPVFWRGMIMGKPKVKEVLRRLHPLSQGKRLHTPPMTPKHIDTTGGGER
jgi:hypothetical protein